MLCSGPERESEGRGRGERCRERKEERERESERGGAFAEPEPERKTARVQRVLSPVFCLQPVRLTSANINTTRRFLSPCPRASSAPSLLLILSVQLGLHLRISFTNWNNQIRKAEGKWVQFASNATNLQKTVEFSHRIDTGPQAKAVFTHTFTFPDQ